MKILLWLLVSTTSFKITLSNGTAQNDAVYGHLIIGTLGHEHLIKQVQP